jgi:hypothetical protein
MLQQWHLHPFVAEYAGNTLVDIRFIGLRNLTGEDRWQAVLAGSTNLVVVPVNDFTLRIAVDHVLSGDPAKHILVCSGLFAFLGSTDARWEIMGPAGAFFSQHAEQIRTAIEHGRVRAARENRR